MRDDVHVILNNEIKASIFVYSGLPKIPGFIASSGGAGAFACAPPHEQTNPPSITE